MAPNEYSIHKVATNLKVQWRHLLTSRGLINVFKYGIHTTSCSQVRAKKNNRGSNLPFEDPFENDISHDFNYHDNQQYEDINFMASDLAIAEEAEQIKKWRKKVSFKITSKKFFSPEPQPNMLTYNEKLCIKHLNKEDPEQWDIVTLSESFPATPEVIKKVLKSKWKPTPEKIQKMDKVVQKNWELLNENKLDASPEVIEHLKKFTQRRQVLLDQLKDQNWFFPKTEKKVTWNNGEMCNILKFYEKSLQKLHQENSLKLHETFVTDGTSLIEGDKPNSVQQEKSGLNIDPTKIEKKTQTFHTKERESYVVSKILHHFSNTTSDELHGDFFTKTEDDGKISSKQREYIEKTYGRNKLEHIVEGKGEAQTQSVEALGHKTNLKNGKNKNMPLTKFGKEKSVHISYSSEKPDDLTERKHEFKKYQEMHDLDSEQGIVIPPKPGCGTLLVSEFEIGNTLQKKEVTEEQPETKKLRKSIVRFNHLAEVNPERLEKDSLYYEKEVEDISGTPFWSSHGSQKLKKIIEVEKAPLQAPEEPHKAMLNSMASLESYPQRIKIPRSKRGSGLTFKVKDCYYDDDGQFLYRVPGMMS
ncbi:hypothetical protein RUM44_006049 [Polyplax serrata]|uniref:Neurite outgrowth-associated protein n=1 Tax=Polyplax serrata TaxID=468196 RepID=A0ABR1AYU4_POLSC